VVVSGGGASGFPKLPVAREMMMRSAAVHGMSRSERCGTSSAVPRRQCHWCHVVVPCGGGLVGSALLCLRPVWRRLVACWPRLSPVHAARVSNASLKLRSRGSLHMA